MTAIASTGRRITPKRGESLSPGRITSLAVTATKHVKAGGLVMKVAAGTVEPGAAGTGNVCLGVSQTDADNTLSLSPAPKAQIETGIFPFFQTGTTITNAHWGQTVYMADDQTVTLTAAGNSPAGVMVGLDDDGTSVNVAISPILAAADEANPYSVQSRTLTLTAPTDVAAGQGSGADTDNTSRVYSLGAACPAGAHLLGCAIHLVTPFANPNSDTLSLEIGGTDPDGIVSALDLLGAAGYYDGTAGAQNIEGNRVAAIAGQQLTATLNPGAAGKVSENTVGQVKITIFFTDATDY